MENAGVLGVRVCDRGAGVRDRISSSGIHAGNDRSGDPILNLVSEVVHEARETFFCSKDISPSKNKFPMFSEISFFFRSSLKVPVH
jgi:hypothetical protein